MKHFLRSQLMLLKPFLSGAPLSVVRRGQEAIGKLMAVTHRGDVTYQDFLIENRPASMIIPQDEVSPGIVLYLHGGGYVAGNLGYAKGFGSVLAAKCGIRVLCIAYRLAPEHPFPAAFDDALAAYGYLLSHGYAPGDILLCGESAGGGLCYALCAKLRDKGRTQPAGILAISPWMDLTSSGPSYEINQKVDPSMTVERLRYFADCYLYGGEGDERSKHPRRNPDPEDDRKRKSDPYISPLFAEVNGFPPSLLLVGQDEIMLDDAVGMHQKLQAAGRQSEIVIAPDMWHGYLLYGTKEREGDFTLVRRFIKSCIPHQKKLKWMTLDNAAKIFPASRNRHWSNVFRLSATLTEEVDRAVMQSALDVTVRRFPSIAVRLQAGAFWYYLEEIPKAPTILDEKPYPLSRMPFDDIRRCAFRVLVYKRRVAVEFFHALTDGNGGLVFLKTLVAEYLYQKYGLRVPPGNGVLDRLEEPVPEETEDSFFRYAGPHAVSRKDTDAFRIAGKRVADGYRTNTTFLLDAEAVQMAARAAGVTVTAYLTAILIQATIRVQEKRVKNRKKYKPVKVLIPVNLRKLFPSRTLRNFVLYATPGVDPRLGDYTFAELCRIVHHNMQLQITKKNMAAMIATNVNSEKPLLLRACPLFIKNIVMKMIFKAVGERKSCFSFSNLGLVLMPPEFVRHVSRLDFVLGAQSSAPYNTSLITYEGTMYLNVIRHMADAVLEPEIYRALREQGLHVKAEANTRGEGAHVLY